MAKIKKFILTNVKDNVKEMYVDIYCRQGKHRSVGLAFMVFFLLVHHTTETTPYKIELIHQDFARWPCGPCPSCQQLNEKGSDTKLWPHCPARDELLKEAKVMWETL
jgi:hypothetical protein